jgi:predicted nucleic-acid-binding Zn-ribbon protein
VRDGVEDSPVDLEISVYEKPEALIFKNEQARYTVRAWVCKGCGYTELYCV